MFSNPFIIKCSFHKPVSVNSKNTYIALLLIDM